MFSLVKNKIEYLIKPKHVYFQNNGDKMSLFKKIPLHRKTRGKLRLKFVFEKRPKNTFTALVGCFYQGIYIPPGMFLITLN